MTFQFLDLRPVTGTFQTDRLVLPTFDRGASPIASDLLATARQRPLASWRRGDDGRLECRWYLTPE
ncbi:hypothetical protein RHAL1_04088 [Beijerinckiaceae bacterium RH AL1]|jgi:hypothetical protein|nr:hypothetical protein RHCH11_RHCH11_04013 [Beijerinckiaceae bacterium RH CH11]VVB50011.1 hypothetical protein RHAL8_04009 [Beijerinckiaceae bacterium RH AL8]VVC57150.1 hypothetical protein RHAL1_04088 [Beijerinckiaceae bacterium RH AL1]